MWGMDADTLKHVNENGWTEVYMLNEDGTLTVDYGDGDALTFTFNEPLTYTFTSEDDTTTTTSLLAPNVLRQVSVQKESGLTDVSTLTFGVHGMQVTFNGF